MSSNREIHRQNREKLAAACEKFGYLTTQQVADLIFPNKASRLRLAQRLIATLREDAWLVTQRDRVTFEQRVANGPNGITFLRERGVNAARGTDLLRYHSEHRIASNSYLIECLNDDMPRVISEREIQKAEKKSWLGKIPDGIVIQDEDENAAEILWLEVENSRRDKKRFEELRSFIEKAHEIMANTERLPEIKGTTLADKKVYLIQIVLYATRKECNETLHKIRWLMIDKPWPIVQCIFAKDD